MTITFVGHGYVGLVSACVFADFGNKVWVIGRNESKIAKLKAGDPLIYEPGLKELLDKNLAANRLFFTVDYDKALTESDIIFIAVGTPIAKNGQSDLSSINDVAKKIATNLTKTQVVVACKSTVPLGTNKKIAKLINDNKSSKTKVHMASCPEFLREGTAVFDTLNPDRIVIGSDSQKAIDLLLDFHKPLNGKRVVTDLASAELIKYTANAMLANKVSFANLIAFYCEKTEADVETVLDAVGLDKRLGRIFLSPGIGYGGSCLPKDVTALIGTGERLDIDTSLLKSINKINQQARQNFKNKIVTNARTKKVAVWGLSFKPNTDDIRDAPAVYILQELLGKGFQLKVYDPAAMDKVRSFFGKKLKYASSPYEALEEASALCIFTEWNEFKEVDLRKVKSLLAKPIIFDGRNIYNPQQMHQLGFKYFSIGRS